MKSMSAVSCERNPPLGWMEYLGRKMPRPAVALIQQQGIVDKNRS